MKSLLLGLLAAITAVFLGIDVITPEEKPYTPASYWQPDITDQPDYRSIFQSITGNGVDDSESCDDGKRSLSDLGGSGIAHMNGTSSPLSANGKFWTYTFRSFNNDKGDAFRRLFLTQNSQKISNGDSAIAPMKASPEENTNVYLLPEKTAIIAPGNGYILWRSIKINAPYPDDYLGNGNMVHGSEGQTFDYVVEPTTNDPNYYKFTYGGLLRMWNCILKSAPDTYADGSSATQPLYTQDSVKSGRIDFNAGDILAETGNTATPKTARESAEYKGLTFTLITVSRSTDGSDWARIPIEDFYYPPT